MNESSRRDEFVAKLKSQLDELNRDIDELEARARKTSGELEKKYQDQLDDVRARREELKNKIKELRTASEARIDKLKLEAEHAWKAFNNSVKYFKSHFK